MRQDFDLTNFTAGELSPRLKGRTDYAKYFNGAAELLNFVVMPQGGITRRPGTIFVAPVWNQAAKPRMRRFQFSTTQAYMLEVGANYVRVYADDGLVLNDQAVTGAINNGSGAIRLLLASAAGLYNGNLMTVTGVTGTVEANGLWLINAVTVGASVLGTANNGNGTIRLQVGSTSHFINGSSVLVQSVGGTIEANGTWMILIVDATHVDLQGSVYVNAWTSGGSMEGNDAFAVDLVGSAFVHTYISGGTTSTPVQIPTPYALGDLPTLYFTQSDDVLFITHPSYPAATLSRSSNVQWSYQPLVFRDGPYLDVNATTTTLTTSSGSHQGGRVIFKYGFGGYTYETTPGDASHSVQVVASSTLGINTTPDNVGQGFLATDVGRHLRIKLLASWAWLIIEVVVSPTEVLCSIQPTVYGGAWGSLDGVAWVASTYYPVGVIVANGGHIFQCVQAGVSQNGGSGPQMPGSGATSTLVGDATVVWNFTTGTVTPTTTFWRLGKWSVGVYPYVCSFWQQRLMLPGSNLQPNAIEASVSGDFTNFAPTQQDGTVVDTNALSFVISDDQVDAIQWVKTAGSAQAAQLAIGCVGAEQILQAYSTAQPLTPTNIQVYGETANGSRAIEPLRIGKSLLFFDRPGRKLFEWTFLWQVNGYDTVELSAPSEHITTSGVVAAVYAQAPHRLIWMLLENGSLVSASYNKDQVVFAPTRHVLGGDYYGGPPIVESIDLIPSPDTSYDQLWLSVLRTINGVPFRSIEVFSPWFENDVVPQDEAVFLDCSLSTVPATPGATLTVSGLTNTASSPDLAPSFTGTATLTASANIFNGASVNQVVRIAGGKIVVTDYTSPTVVTGQVIWPLTNLAPQLWPTWSMAPLVSSVNGLGYLGGETVGILGDGADFGTATVTGGGTVSLAGPGAFSPSASLITVGLPFCSAMVTMPFEPQRAAAASSQGKAKRIDTMWMRFHESLGCDFGQRLTDPLTFVQRDKMEAMQTRAASMLMGQAPPLFSGSRQLRPQGGYDEEGQMTARTTSPLPLTILSIYAKADVGLMPQGGG